VLRRLSVPLLAAALVVVPAPSADAKKKRKHRHGGTAYSQTQSGEAPQPVALDRGEIKDMQRALDVTVDGEIGPETRGALRRYERSQGMYVDGRPDAQVLDALGVDWDAGSATPAPSGKAAEAVAAARSAIGTPYASAGTTKDGFDCSGLTQWAYKKAGVRLPRTSFDQFGVGDPVARSEVRAGDLVFFDTAGSGASHVGIATSRNKAISATSSGGVMEHSTRDDYWGAHYVGARRP
jgi:peptidoglycan DL-endopeptidase CwlO